MIHKALLAVNALFVKTFWMRQQFCCRC